MSTFYEANQSYNSTLSSDYTVGDTTLGVAGVPSNTPTIVTVARGTNKETRFTITGTGIGQLTGVARLDGANENIAAGSSVECMNDEEFINQLSSAVYDQAALKGLVYAADGGSSDDYAITLPVAPTAYTDLVGVSITFKANTANTGACTLNVNSLGAKAIKTPAGADPADNTILASSIVVVVYDGTNFQLTSDNKTLTSPTITGTASASADGLNVSSMSRQAIINGNIDVWQRGTSVALTAANGYTADRWYVETATAGTDKTVSRQDGTGVNGSYYCARVAMVQDADELLTFSQALESQDSIKLRGKKLTLSFYARGGAEFVASNATLVSKIVTGKGTDQKVLAFTTSADAVSQNNTLTDTWTKFTCTTTNVIAADITQVGISFAFTHAGSGTTTNYFEITQVQLCAGEVALPFQPKSYGEEERACKRFFYRIKLGSAYDFMPVYGYTVNTTTAYLTTHLQTEMRTYPATTYSGSIGIKDMAGGFTAISALSSSASSPNIANLTATSTGVTANRFCTLQGNNDANAYVDLSSEL
jgi:hypothetical protein